MQLRKAERQQSKMVIGLSAPSGAGKTYSALLLAYGMTGDWSKIALIDTENGSGDLYSHLGDYNILPLEAPYSPERFIEAITACEQGGVDIIVIDSTTHEWDGKGGCLEINDAIAQSKFKGNTWSAWSQTGARHQKFIEKILSSKCHIITTVRNKVETAQVDGKIKKLGTKEIQREGFEYELTINFNIEREGHTAMASKDRTGLFIDRDPFVITPEIGRELINWNQSGVKIPTDNELYEKFETELKNCKDLEELRKVFFEVSKNESKLGKSFYDNLFSLKDDMKASLSSEDDKKSKVGELMDKQKQEHQEIKDSEEFKQAFGDDANSFIAEENAGDNGIEN